MRTLAGLLLTAFVLAPASQAVSGNVVATENVKARLIAETRSIAPAGSAWVALVLDIRDGWHTYWKNPGDSGQATRLSWTLPPGWSASEIHWPTPHRFELAPLVNYGYAHQAVHLVELQAPAGAAPGTTVTLHAKASWLVCADVCIPESAELTLPLPVTAQPGALDETAEPLFLAARAALPRAAPAPATARIVDGQLRIDLERGWSLPAHATLAFYALDEGSIEYAAPQTLTRRDDGVELAMKIGYQPVQTGAVHGVLVVSGAPGESAPQSYEIAATLAGHDASAVASPRYAHGPADSSVAAAPSAGPQVPDASGSPGAPPALAWLALLALLGGLILNLMPCVFPVLSMKAIGLVEQAKKHPAAVRRKGLLFAGGVITSMLTLAGALLALRAGGEQIGWGFQLQSPLFVTLMIYLLLAVGLNLSGVFEVGAGLTGVGDSLTHGDTYRAAFFTGVLTTLVATPCTAPFMATAVGAALTQSAGVALIIFAALGVGLALPFLVVSLAPWTRRLLPKPGAWMD